MIKNAEYLRNFELEIQLYQPSNFFESLEIFEMLMAEAKMLNAWHPEVYAENIKKDIEIARVLNWKKI
ncbi:MAG TPA: hypothetical protein PKY81_05530 [bacterium]|nr:hypothetical protein [bacterium]